jgi:hypothetical protein
VLEPPVLDVPLDELAVVTVDDEEDEELEEAEAWDVEVVPPVPVLVAWLEPHAASVRDTSATDDDVRACPMRRTRRRSRVVCCQARSPRHPLGATWRQAGVRVPLLSERGS